MAKTQIQIPEELYREIKSFAQAREWSLAEAFRRGSELLLEVYDDHPHSPTAAWTPPVSASVGWRSLSPAALRDAAWQDMDPTLKMP